MATKSDEFGVWVKNRLLDQHHFEAIGDSLWLYLWFMDRVTQISKDTGLGLVLNGKPFKLADFGMTSEKVTRKMFRRLEDGGYIEVLRTPYGNRVWVTKCVKWFGNRLVGFTGTEQMQLGIDLPKREDLDKLVPHRPAQTVTPPNGKVRPPQTVRSNKTSTSNINITNNTNSLVADEPATQEKHGDDDIRLALLLNELTRANYGFIKPLKPEKSAKDAEELNRLHRIDGFSYEVIEAVIRWSQQDSFWKQNIRSAAKLRKQFETLVIKAKHHVNRGVVVR